MPYYHTCPDCGSNNDPGETCECKRGALAVVFERDGKPVTTSRVIAEQFEKNHKHVLRDIKALIDSPDLDCEFSQLNFVQSTYKTERGKVYPECLLTKDGFTLLVMGYTGARAMQFKVAYINAFNEMEAALQRRTAPVLPSSVEPAALPAPDIAAHLLAIMERLQALETQQRPVPALPANPATRMRITTPLLSKKLLTVPELCAYMSIGRNTALDLLHSEGFPMIRIGVRLLADRVKLDQWIAERTHTGVDVFDWRPV